MVSSTYLMIDNGEIDNWDIFFGGQNPDVSVRNTARDIMYRLSIHGR